MLLRDRIRPLLETRTLLKDGELLVLGNLEDNIVDGLVPGILVGSIDGLLDAGDAVTTASLNLPNVTDDHRTSGVESFALSIGNLTHQGCKLGLVPLDNFGAAEQPQDSRRVAEAHEHKAQASILVGMRNRLAAGAGTVNVGALVWTEHGEMRIGKSLGGYIYMSTVRGRRSCEEDRLTLRPLGQVVREGGEELHLRASVDTSVLKRGQKQIGLDDLS